MPSNLINEHFDDRYFDVISALDEAQHVFFANNNLLERLAAGAGSGLSFVIGETGFGAGRNVVSLMEYLSKDGLANLDIDYFTVELYPLSVERMLSILSGFRDRVGAEIDCLVDAYRQIDLDVPGWHTMIIDRPFGTISLHLWLGEAMEMIQALEHPCEIWFLDGHGPKKNPLMWRSELMLAIADKTEPGGSCATFTVAGDVKRSLTAAGFHVNKRPGFGGKREVLQAMKTKATVL